MRILFLKITSLILLLSVEFAVYAFFNFRRHMYPNWSPKSHLIAFESKTELNFHGERHIWLLDSISSKSSRLIQGTNPFWIADGQKIAFIREFDEEKNRDGEIYSIKIDGSKLFKISDNWKGYAPHWSGDGKKLVFIYQLSGGKKVYAIDFQTNKFIDIKKNKLSEDVFSTQNSVSWSPDNQEIVFCVYKSKDNLSVIDYSKVYITKVDETSKINFVAEGYSPSWSPDGKQIAFVSYQGNRLLIFNIGNKKTTELAKLTDNSFIHSTPVWSSDSKHLAFVAATSEFSRWSESMTYIKGKIYTIALNKPKQLDFLTEGTHPTWSPDNKKIAFSLNNRVAIINFDGSGFKFLSKRLEFSNLIKAIFLLSIISGIADLVGWVARSKTQHL